MTTTDRVPDGTLEEQIAAFKAQMASQAPAEVVATFDKNVDEVVKSGIAEQSLKVGEHAPDFTLPDVAGQQVTLSEQLKQGPVVVTFYRGDWCPYCNLQLRAYQNILPQIKALGASLVAISPQTPDNSLTTVEKKGLTFKVLSDVGNKVAREYGLVFAIAEHYRALYSDAGLNVPALNGDSSWELPIAGTFIIDRDGTARLASVDADWTHRLEPAALLDGLRAVVNSK
ncbi:MAG: peroxiredoxin-like family protein [Ktedonobacteraceae bacterium]